MGTGAEIFHLKHASWFSPMCMSMLEIILLLSPLLWGQSTVLSSRTIKTQTKTFVYTGVYVQTCACMCMCKQAHVNLIAYYFNEKASGTVLNIKIIILQMNSGTILNFKQGKEPNSIIKEQKVPI